jgi:hypothetical protein
MYKMAKGIFHPKGIGKRNQRKVKTLVSDLFLDQCKNPLFFARPVAFAFYGIHPLTTLVSNSEFTNPRIERSNFKAEKNYWLAFDVNEESLVIDPFFRYVGLEKYAGEVLGREQVRCYEDKRIVHDQEELKDEVVSVKDARKKTR